MAGSGRSRAARLGVAAVLALATGACDQVGTAPDSGARPGTALAPTTSGSLAAVTLPPGQEVIELGAGLRNASSEPLEITKLRAANAPGVPAVAEVVRIALVDRASIDVAAGVFVTFPPVTRRNGECMRAKVSPARGSILQPGDDSLILVWLRAITAGRAAVPALTVSYEQEGDLFRQRVELDGGPVLHVRRAAKAIEPNPDERACASGVQLLPGAVHI